MNDLALQANDIRSFFEKNSKQIAYALPKHMSVDRVIRMAMTSIQKNPTLLKCNTISIFAALIQSSQLGLEIDSVLGYAYLVPFYNSAKKSYEAQFIPGYKGLIDLARRSGRVSVISAHVVYEHEQFNIEYGVLESLKHKPLPPSSRGEKRVGVYAIAKMKDGSTGFNWLWAEEVEETKQKSLSKMRTASGPWIDNEDEMWKKTAIRRLAKLLPLSPEFAKAAAIDELSDAGIDTSELFDVTFQENDAAPKKTIDEALDELSQKQPETTIEDQPVQPAQSAQPEEAQQPAPKAEDKKNDAVQQETLETVLADIASYNIPLGPLTAYVVRAIGVNKSKSCWDFDEAKKILASIQQAKGGKK